MTSVGHASPPRWSQRVLQAWLPDDSMRDAIIGDLHEELVRDAEHLGMHEARTLYRQRVAGIVAYAMIDAIRWRPWGSTGPDVRVVPVVSAGSTPAPVRSKVRRADMWILAGAFGVLGIGIVGNTMLFSATQHAPGAVGAATMSPAVGAATVSPAVGAASVILALGSAACAAVVLCVGPRWLRKRLCRKTIESQRTLT